MDIKELKEQIKDLPDDFKIQIYSDGFKDISKISIIHTKIKDKLIGTFNLEFEK